MTRFAWLSLAALLIVAGGGLLFAADEGVGVVASGRAAEAPPSFRNDVMAILSKAGCNAGACHGNKSGKGGFKLSLRGQDVEDDYAALTRDALGRRVNLLEPGESLLLQKPTGRVAHEGGLRFRPDSPEYRTLYRWVDAGAPRDGTSAPTLVRVEVTPGAAVLIEPADRVRIRAVAVFSDGSRRDVSRVACYEQSTDLADISVDGEVRRKRFGEVTVVVRYLQCQEPVRLAFVPARASFAWGGATPANYVDEAVFGKLRTMRINASPDCGDAVFVRRAYLDLLGVLPTAAEARAFVADVSADKRARLVGRLFDRPEYADHWALKWSDLLRNEERTLDRKGVQAFHGWIRRSVAENKPLDRFVRELLAGRGSTYANPPANYYRANRDPVTRGEATAQLFLGVRLQCAQCHNHPFDRWTQDDYYQWADVFARVGYKVLENARTDTNDSHEFVGEQVVYESRAGDVKDPRGDRQVVPRLLGEGGPLPEAKDRLDALAAWVTSPSNAYFARSQVNRIWFHLMGRGLVDPVDDFRPTNPASHPELLDALAKDFVAHGYDVRHVIRTIMASKAYAVSGTPDEGNADDEVNYSHALPRRLTAEQMLDAMHEVMGVPAEFAGYPKGMRAGQIPGVKAVKGRGPGPRVSATQADVFLQTFGKPARLLVCECERSNETTLGQTFQLIDGPGLVELLANPSNRLGRMIGQGASNESIVDELYWSAVGRGPEADESAAMVSHVEKAKDRRKGLEDVAWALLNSKEFVFRR